MRQSSPLKQAHDRLLARGDDADATVDPRDFGAEAGAGRRPPYEFVLERYGVEAQDMDEFLRDGIAAVAEAVAGGADLSSAIASMAVTALLTGCELARDPRADVEAEAA